MPNTKYGTDFIESEAILAAQEEDEAYLDELLFNMSPESRRRLSNACDLIIRQARPRRFSGRGRDGEYSMTFCD